VKAAAAIEGGFIGRVWQRPNRKSKDKKKTKVGIIPERKQYIWASSNFLRGISRGKRMLGLKPGGGKRWAGVEKKVKSGGTIRREVISRVGGDEIVLKRLEINAEHWEHGVWKTRCGFKAYLCGFW